MLTAHKVFKSSVDRYVNLMINRMFSKHYFANIEQLALKSHYQKTSMAVKIKGLRANLSGVTDVKFFLFSLQKLFV